MNLGRQWRCPSRRAALISARVLKTAPSHTHYPQTSFSYSSTTRLDLPSKEIDRRACTAPRGSGSLLIERYRLAGVCTSPTCRHVPRTPRSALLTSSGLSSPSMLQQRSSSTNASKGDDARSTEKSAPSATDCDHTSHKHPTDHSHSHSIFHSHSHDDDHDHSHGAEQVIHVFEGKGAWSFTGCHVLALMRVRQATGAAE